jgi:hypothetical protein
MGSSLLLMLFGATNATAGSKEACALLTGASAQFADLSGIIVDPPPVVQPTRRYYLNREAGEMHGVQRLRLLQGVMGENSAAGVWDEAAVYGQHEQLDGRVTAGDVKCEGISSTLCFGQHATHVAGTIASSGKRSSNLENDPKKEGENSEGMAPKATIYSFKEADNEFITARQLCDQATGIPFYVSNHSYGYPSGWYYGYQLDKTDRKKAVANYSTREWTWYGKLFGKYDQVSDVFDKLIFALNDLSVFRSAGNR